MDRGELPSGWIEANVRSLASIVTGPFGTLLKASEYGGSDGVPLISVGEIRDGYFSVTDDTPIVGAAVTRRLPQYLLQEGDIVFGRKGGVERSAIVTKAQSGWFLGSDGIAIRLNDQACRPYFGHALRSDAVRAWLLQNASGTTMPSLNQEVLGSVRLRFPERRAEQEAIAEVLSDADGVIEGLERLVAKKRLIKQGAMRNLLTARRRLPGFAGEWLELPLGAFGKCMRGVSYDGQSDLFESDTQQTVRLLRANNIQGSKLMFSDLQFVNAARVGSHQYLRRNDVVICMANGSRALVGKSGRFVAPDEMPYTFGAFMGAFRSDEDARDAGFVGHLINSDQFRHLEPPRVSRRPFCVSQAART